MREDKLSNASMDFAIEIINLVKELKEKRESIISNQIGRSGTSIGANIREAHYAHGMADFIAKLQIALKEANETTSPAAATPPAPINSQKPSGLITINPVL